MATTTAEQGAITYSTDELAAGITSIKLGELLARNASDKIVAGTTGEGIEFLGQYNGREYDSGGTFPNRVVPVKYGHRFNVRVNASDDAAFDDGFIRIKGSGTSDALVAADAGKKVYLETSKQVAVEGKQSANAPWVGWVARVTRVGTSGDGQGEVQSRPWVPTRGTLLDLRYQSIGMGDQTHALIRTGTAAANQSLLRHSLLLVDAESSGSEEILKLPPEADSAGLSLTLVNVGDEAVHLQDDGGTVSHAYLRPGQITIAFCDGSAWKARTITSKRTYRSLAASSAISNVNTEQDFDVTHTVPANLLKPGDRIRVAIGVVATSTNSTDTLTLKAYIGSTVVAQTAAIDVANGDTSVIFVDAVVRSVGATGSIVAVSLHHGPDAETTGADGGKSTVIASIDTTAAITLKVSATWSAASAANSCRLDLFNVDID